ncbi:MAG: type II toxin-antitoxin system RelE family toxin [Pseudomonadota bacterium]
MREVVYLKRARKALSSMPTPTARRIVAKIEQYAADPLSQANNVTRLQGRDGFRLRVGDWRVIFSDDGVVLAIIHIGPRGGVYE